MIFVGGIGRLLSIALVGLPPIPFIGFTVLEIGTLLASPNSKSRAEYPLKSNSVSTSPSGKLCGRFTNHPKEKPMITKAIARNSIHQWGGAAFVLGNVLFIVNKLNEMSRLFLGHWMPEQFLGEVLW